MKTKGKLEIRLRTSKVVDMYSRRFKVVAISVPWGFLSISRIFKPSINEGLQASTELDLFL